MKRKSMIYIGIGVCSFVVSNIIRHIKRNNKKIQPEEVLSPEELLRKKLYKETGYVMTEEEETEFDELCKNFTNNSGKIPSLDDILQIGKIYGFKWAKKTLDGYVEEL